MAAGRTLPDLLQRTREIHGEEILYRFANGLCIKTEIFEKRDRLRILPLGNPQGSLMNHLLSFPETVRAKRVFEPFAGSGALGFMALAAGAAHAEFLDINPRALDFQRENAAMNGFASDRFNAIEGDIADFTPARRYDLILANPPFVPTPDGIEGTLTSNGGPEGNRFVEILLDRLEELLDPGGQALVCLFQLAVDGRPLILDLLARGESGRGAELTPSQARHLPFETYCRAYSRLFPKQEAAIGRWRSDLLARHAGRLTLCHYVLHLGPRSTGSAGPVIRENFAEKFGEDFLVPSENPEELAFGRAFENLVPDSHVD